MTIFVVVYTVMFFSIILTSRVNKYQSYWKTSFVSNCMCT